LLLAVQEVRMVGEPATAELVPALAPEQTGSASM
jgi:hypothetical protein